MLSKFLIIGKINRVMFSNEKFSMLEVQFGADTLDSGVFRKKCVLRVSNETLAPFMIKEDPVDSMLQLEGSIQGAEKTPGVVRTELYVHLIRELDETEY